MVEIGKFIRPFLPVIDLFQFFQDLYPLSEVYVLGDIHLVLENVLAAFTGSYAYKLFVILQSLDRIPELYGQLAQRINDPGALRMPFVSQLEDFLALLIPVVHLVEIAYGAEHRNALHAAPVNGIGYFCGFFVFLLRNEIPDLICAGFVFVFVHKNPSGRLHSRIL